MIPQGGNKIKLNTTEEKTIRLCGKCAAISADKLHKLRLLPARSKKAKCDMCQRMRYTLKYEEEKEK